tara:strand:- start:2745 stop:3077 length:333 start_codon:yes stop_codon:yes gene_type:complete
MRKITQQIKQAFEQGESLKVGNTRTDGTSVFLHGNEIIRRDVSGLVFATLAGWNTPTTRERVNGITGMGFHQVGFVACLNGEPVCEDDWFVQCHDGTSQALPPSPLEIAI